MSETPGQVLARIMFGDVWPELDDEQRATWEMDAAAFLAEMRCVRFVPSDAAEVELPFDPDDYPVR